MVNNIRLNKMYRGLLQGNCSDYFIVFLLSNAATGETTAAQGEKTTAVPHGKTPNNMGKEMKKYIIQTICYLTSIFLICFLNCLLWNVRLGLLLPSFVLYR